MQFKVRLLNDSRQEFSIDSDHCTIGRSSKCTVVITDEGMSRQHCQIDFIGEEYYITDLGSINGVFIDDQKIVPHQRTLYKIYKSLSFGPVKSLEIIERQTQSFKSPLKAELASSPERKQRLAKDIVIPARKAKSTNQFMLMNVVIFVFFASFIYWYLNRNGTIFEQPRIPKERLDAIEEFSF